MNGILKQYNIKSASYSVNKFNSGIFIVTQLKVYENNKNNKNSISYEGFDLEKCLKMQEFRVKFLKYFIC